MTARDVRLHRRGDGGEQTPRVLAGHTRLQIDRATTALFDLRQTHLTDYHVTHHQHRSRPRDRTEIADD
jgi:hypothetical protein